ncbi:MAG: phosphoribosylformimino-5-aminoimidazole carboxamide ribotide isomerase [Myxococcales bacterium]|jgi:phosphoribosylformimino-5-aminoimidazole carboxamide ribotide isomerase|nr:phosphoribosylformimino-5-aminoimidazole carboxamide ribotide isomerase [Myxococcales bacterium]
MTLFRPCIDIHDGQVKQIVGATLRDGAAQSPVTNFVAPHDAAHYAERYRSDALHGGHVIMLGPGNEAAAERALSAWPDGLQLGGGIHLQNAAHWIALGAQKVIVTSWLFRGAQLDMARVGELSQHIGPERLVIDLSCKRVGDGWRVATNRWQTVTEVPVNRDTLAQLAQHCSEFLVHAADVEGQCRGIDEDLVVLLGRDCPIPCTYAGGAKHIDDLDRVAQLSDGRVDLTFGSALDIFGGALVRYADCVAWNQRRLRSQRTTP